MFKVDSLALNVPPHVRKRGLGDKVGIEEISELDTVQGVAGNIQLADEISDSPEAVARHIPEDILGRYEVYSYRNAALVLKEAFPSEFNELMEALRAFKISTSIIRAAGGNESEVPKTVSGLLRRHGWHETSIQADLQVKLSWREPGLSAKGRAMTVPKEREIKRSKFLDGHKVDYVKNRVAFDLEWNSKDQTFDRDLYAFSAFAQCGVIDVGVLLTRSLELNPIFAALGVGAKYGASTTHMGKLLYRLNAGRNGSCPVLAIGIKPGCIEDWPPI
ncbi:BglII/BstYI family type II restriction endonuclease [Sphingobium yanoikuyae]|uniref:BglII/BstYI family type II restriction endonuclease n=1 Tax=Sphingobium yanoikuyae TaxID=13690 RepID=UPI002FDCB4D2